MVGRHAVDELMGVAAQLIALLIDTDQVGQANVQADLQRHQITAAPVALPARGQGGVPVDVRARRGQQGFETRQHRLGAFQESIQASVHDDS
ncbi:hypothetical protein D3C80_1711980 [compost metagenome]